LGWYARLIFASLEKDIKALLAGKSVAEFVTGVFADQMSDALTNNQGVMVIHTLTSLNCANFNAMRGGFLVETVNPNPDYGLLGAARALADFWQINRWELQAFKNVGKVLSVEQRQNFGLQITNVRGTQAGGCYDRLEASSGEYGDYPRQGRFAGGREYRNAFELACFG
jgi:hypothetical protein